jgi:hypothetical protein
LGLLNELARSHTKRKANSKPVAYS